MKVLVFFSKRKNIYEYKRLKDESKKYRNINFHPVENLSLPFEQNIFENYDIFYFYSSLSLRIDSHLLARYLYSLGKTVINRNLIKYRVFDKTTMYIELSRNRIRVPEFIKIYDKRFIDKVKSLGFPLVVKHILQHRGKGVYLIKNENELKRFLNEKNEVLAFYVFQKFVKYKHDLRIIIVGDKILGAMERIPQGGFKANISQGGIGKKFEINEEIEELVYRIADIFDLQIAGIDILIDYEGNYYVIDINREMQFRGFERFTGINVAKEIIDYLANFRS